MLRHGNHSNFAPEQGNVKVAVPSLHGIVPAGPKGWPPFGGSGLAELCDSVAFLDANYEEAVVLAIEARDYMARQKGVDRGGHEPFERMAMSAAALRVTARLTQVMAWLLVQKAVQAGEMTRADAASEPYCLSGQEVCLDEGPLPEEGLPPAFAQIEERSRRLYERIPRLDALIEATGG